MFAVCLHFPSPCDKPLQSQLGTESKISAYCGSFSGGAIQTTDGFRQEMSERCANSVAFSEEAKASNTIEEGDMATYLLVLTAGLVKLSVSATGSGVGGAASKTGGSMTTPKRSKGSMSAAAPIYMPA
jgi:hypothetical protein